jgi:decaprenylphospho-beta-D-erythro-pentofuranosid-2-ulose 2-reductase
MSDPNQAQPVQPAPAEGGGQSDFQVRNTRKIDPQYPSDEKKPKDAPMGPRNVVILGALSAIAVATARLYAAQGSSIVLVARNLERLKITADDLKARGAKQVEIEAIDLSESAGGAASYLAGWKQKLGEIDHVLLFYGYLGSQEQASADIGELQKILAVNFTSAALWSEATANVLRAQKHGSLVAISSVAGDRGRQSNYAYGSAKGGLALYVQGLAHSLAPTGARAVAMKLGFVDTPMTADLKKGGPLWAKPEGIAPSVLRAAEKGGPIQYAPTIWKLIMLVIRSVPSFVFHKTKL